MSKEYSRSLNGNAIPEAYRKTEIRYTGGETLAEVLALGHAENEAAVVRAFYNSFSIAANPMITKLANEGVSLADIGAAVAKQCIKSEVSKGGGGSVEGLEKARAVQAARKEKAAKMDNLAAAAAADPELAAKLAALGF